MKLENELRIGNYVHFKSEDDDFSIELKFEFESGWNMDYIKPIPLTEERLVKFGAKEIERSKSGILKTYVLEDMIFEVSNSGNIYYRLFAKLIPYVHTLQNFIFAIKEKELTLKTEL